MKLPSASVVAVLVLGLLQPANPALHPQAASSQSPIRSSGQTSTSTQDVPPTKGLIDNGTYKNPSIGLELTPAAGLHLEEPELRGAPGEAPLVTVTARADPGLFSGLFSARSETTFYAEALARYPAEQRNADRYMQKVIPANTEEGFRQSSATTFTQLGGNSFRRTDFVKAGLRETILVTTNGGYALVFIFAGSSVEVTKKLIASTNIKLISPQ